MISIARAPKSSTLAGALPKKKYKEEEEEEEGTISKVSLCNT